MSKHNYTQYSNKRHNDDRPARKNRMTDPVEPVVDMQPVIASEVQPDEVKMVVETVETVTPPKSVKGTVAHCTKLNVRSEPSITAEVVCVLDARSEVKIDASKSTSDWLNICTASGAEGYCMRKFVDARL